MTKKTIKTFLGMNPAASQLPLRTNIMLAMRMVSTPYFVKVELLKCRWKFLEGMFPKIDLLLKRVVVMIVK